MLAYFSADMYFHFRGMDRTAENPKLSPELLHVQQFTFRSMSIQQDFAVLDSHIDKDHLIICMRQDFRKKNNYKVVVFTNLCQWPQIQI